MINGNIDKLQLVKFNIFKNAIIHFNKLLLKPIT